MAFHIMPSIHRKIRHLSLLPCALVLIVSSGCSVFGVESVEEATYQLVMKEEQFEVRDYAPQVFVETRVDAGFNEASNESFRKLFAYISGENEASQKIAMTAPVIAEKNISRPGEKIAMTAPVIAQREGEAWLLKFVLPRSYSLGNAPRPLNPDVSLAVSDTKRVASVQYSGRATDKARAKHAEALASWVRSQGLTLQSEPRWAGYNPPWTLPPLRRNEVHIDVSSQ